jgi:hypothetical protein
MVVLVLEYGALDAQKLIAIRPSSPMTGFHSRTDNVRVSIFLVLPGFSYKRYKPRSLYVQGNRDTVTLRKSEGT